MKITLRPDQERWLEAQVASAQFDSINQAVAVAVANLMANYDDDLGWAKPYADRARTSIARGDAIGHEEYFRRLNTMIDTLRST